MHSQPDTRRQTVDLAMLIRSSLLLDDGRKRLLLDALGSMGSDEKDALRHHLLVTEPTLLDSLATREAETIADGDDEPARALDSALAAAERGRRRGREDDERGGDADAAEHILPDVP